ncbi:MAG: hypothetical protein ACOY0T_00070 [Myxococcota bacterium]
MAVNEGTNSKSAGDFPAVTSAVVAAVILYVVATLVGKSYGAAFFAIPFFIGLIAGLFSASHPYRDATLAFLAAILLSIGFLQEGVVCLLFALPLFIPGLFAGAACGARLGRYVKNRAQRRGAGAGILMLGLLAQAIDSLMDDPGRHPLHFAEASIDLAAAPERVFAALTAEPMRVNGRWQWFLRLGLPMPSELRLEPSQKRVVLSFNHGKAFADVSELRPGRAFAFHVTRYEIEDPPFHITRLGRGPHYGLRTERVNDWLSLESVRYRLEPTPNGGTRLVRELSWRRHLAPDFYFGWLQQTVMERGQRRLLEFIRGRVDGAPAQGSNGLEPVALR